MQIRILIAFLLLIFLSISVLAEVKSTEGKPSLVSPPRISLEIICENQEISRKIEQIFAKRLQREELTLVSPDAYPPILAGIVVRARQDKDKEKDNNGWTLGTAFVSNQKTFFLSAKLLKNKEIKQKKEIMSLLFSMIDERGFIKRANSMHADEFGDENIAFFADTTTSEFMRRLEGYLQGE